MLSEFFRSVVVSLGFNPQRQSLQDFFGDFWRRTWGHVFNKCCEFEEFENIVSSCFTISMNILEFCPFNIWWYRSKIWMTIFRGNSPAFVKQCWQVEVLRQICVYILLRNSGRLFVVATVRKFSAELETPKKRLDKDGCCEFEGCQITLIDPKVIQGWNYPPFCGIIIKFTQRDLAEMFFSGVQILTFQLLGEISIVLQLVMLFQSFLLEMPASKVGATGLPFFQPNLDSYEGNHLPFKG